MCVLYSCLLCPYLVCVLSLLSVIISSFLSSCVCQLSMIILCIIVLPVQFDFVWFTRYSPVFGVIKDWYLSLNPRLRVP